LTDNANVALLRSLGVYEVKRQKRVHHDELRGTYYIIRKVEEPNTVWWYNLMQLSHAINVVIITTTHTIKTNKPFPIPSRSIVRKSPPKNSNVLLSLACYIIIYAQIGLMAYD
jgi:hypothetical protein